MTKFTTLDVIPAAAVFSFSCAKTAEKMMLPMCFIECISRHSDHVDILMISGNHYEVNYQMYNVLVKFWRQYLQGTVFEMVPEQVVVKTKEAMTQNADGQEAPPL